MCITLGLSEIRYHFTPCGAVGRGGPDYKTCSAHYTQINSPISRDGILVQPDLGSQDYQQHVQIFRVPRDTLYNVSVAGAAGRRGICNAEHGHGLIIHFTTSLSSELRYLVVVGQKGLGPCDLEGYDLDLMCHYTPFSTSVSLTCWESWLEWLGQQQQQLLVNETVMKLMGGGAGGGASLIRSEESKYYAIAVAGGGGGGSAFLNYSVARQAPSDGETENSSEVELYMDFMDAKTSCEDPAISDTNIFHRGAVLTEGPSAAGAGGGCLRSAEESSGGKNGEPICGRNDSGAPLGGKHCAKISNVAVPLDEVDGGFGGGGGGCGGGGAGGGLTGGAILGDTVITPGGGGYSYYGECDQLPTDSAYNYDDGYVDVVAADCGCVYECVVYEEEDQFECLCPNETQLAPDLSDCYRGKLQLNL